MRARQDENNMVVRAQIKNALLELVEGDIVQQDTEAVVNAANSSLLGGGGVDGAIHRAAGPELLAETRTLGGCMTGDAKITRGYRLKAKYIIHAVGPIYRRDDLAISGLLASAYQRSLELAVEYHIRSVAFPSISTGAYGYPLEEAAPIALKTTSDFLANHDSLELVRFVLFNSIILSEFAAALDNLITHHDGLIRVM
jgi:O-acetyl-ADP-ribose deacetylase (regulator of RNase III)